MSWMQTFTGKAFRLDEESIRRVINIKDIAHQLSMTVRFNGACGQFYSVAEHSVRMSWQAEAMGFNKSQQLWCLLHDAAEAYLGDIVSPFKDVLVTQLYHDTEALIMKILTEMYKLEKLEGNLDLHMLATEKRDLMAPEPEPWNHLVGIEPFDEMINPVGWPMARTMFLNRFTELWCHYCENTGWIDGHRCRECNNDGD